MSLRTITDKVVLKPADTHPTLMLLYSPESGICEQVEALRLGGGPTFVGREVEDGAGIALLGDQKASRKHARIECSEQPSDGPLGALGQPVIEVRIVDEQSKNGLFVNGVRVYESTLRDGDLIRVGDSLLLLRWRATELLDGPEHGLIGRSAPMAAVRHRLQDVAQASDKTVLLLGEPGVGKELAAQSLHEQSRRPGRFVAYNCASLTESLADSILYGHERGAFTGADRRTDGLFQMAAQGSLFLDEIGELPLAVQGKLLRALNERMLHMVGRPQASPIDVRVIAATNRDLAAEVQEGRFRNDLYSRLLDDAVHLPTLRERREDILLLLQKFIGTEAHYAPRLVAALVQYDWPHNVRELRQFAHALQRSAERGTLLDLPLVADRFQCQPEPPAPVQSGSEPQQERRRSMAQGQRTTPGFERLTLTKEALQTLLEEQHWNVSAVARVLRRSRRQVRRWMEKFSLT